MREKVYRAGVIPFFVDPNGKVKMNFMIPSDTKYGGADPQFCKGKIEKGENEEDAAIREAIEELGLREENVKWFSYLGIYLGRTYIYICEVEDQNAFDEPHYETAETMWLTLEEFEEQGRSLHKPVIREAHLEFEEIKREEQDGIYDEDATEYEVVKAV